MVKLDQLGCNTSSNASAIACYLRGDGQVRVGNWSAAIDHYDKALQHDPSLALAHMARGIATVAENSWNRKKIESDFRAAIKLDPTLAEAYTSLGVFQIIHHSSEGAMHSFSKALELSNGYALALNGLGCAQYGSNQWQAAGDSFAEAARAVPLPLFLENLHSLGVAVESSYMPGMDDSPLFRFSDFLDWESLREKSTKQESVLYTLLGRPLPALLTVETLAMLNTALNTPEFFERVTSTPGLVEMNQRLEGFEENSRLLRKQPTVHLSSVDNASIRRLNRVILEEAYPNLIARHDQRRPGMQLTRQGFMDASSYRKSIGPNGIVMGQARIDNVWRHGANGLEPIPIVGYVGKMWNRHLDHATDMNRKVMTNQYQLNLDDFREGGVGTKPARVFKDTGHWPVTTVFGLMYTHSVEDQSGGTAQ